MYQIISALDAVGEHRLNLLYMMSSTAENKDLQAGEKQIAAWLRQQENHLRVAMKAVAADSRLDVIEEAAEEADLVVMGAQETSGMERILFGSLVDSVAAKLRKTLIVVYNAGKNRTDTTTTNTSYQEEQP